MRVAMGHRRSHASPGGSKKPRILGAWLVAGLGPRRPNLRRAARWVKCVPAGVMLRFPMPVGVFNGPPSAQRLWAAQHRKRPPVLGVT